VVSGVLQGGFACGFILSAAAFELVYPAFGSNPTLGWRAMLCAGIVPVLLAAWVRARVEESPVWMEGQRPDAGSAVSGDMSPSRTSPWQLFQRGLLGTTVQTSVLVGALMFTYYSISFWYPTFLREAGLPTLRYLVGFNAGSITGHFVWGHLSDGVLGRRGAIMAATLLVVATIPFYVHARDPWILWLGALFMGGVGGGIFGIVPAYLAERFPTATRGVGLGFVYHAGAAIGAITPTLVGALQDRGTMLSTAMSTCIVGSSLLVATVVWLGPETRGRRLT
jgi:SHS family lactate transporter-like MFS transporter